MIQGGEPLLDGGGDGPEHQDQRQVHPPQQRPPQHARLLVEARDVEGDAVECFIGPGDREELEIGQQVDMLLRNIFKMALAFDFTCCHQRDAT